MTTTAEKTGVYNVTKNGIIGDKDSTCSSMGMGEVETPISDSELLRIMECPVCNEFPAPPIYSCEMGHFVCNSCMELLDCCSLCEAKFTRVRNFALESIIESSNFRCTYAHLGCMDIVKGDQLKNHAGKCCFRPLECLKPECLLTNLTPNEYFDHMVKDHQVVKREMELVNGKVSIALKQDGDSDNNSDVMYIELVSPNASGNRGPVFVIFSKRYKTFMCWWASCLQPKELTEYSVSFSLTSKRSEDLRLYWKLPLQPVWKDFQEIRDSGLCAVLPLTNLIPFFIDEHKNWDLQVELTKKQNSSTYTQLIQHYYPLLALVIVGIITVVLSLTLEDRWNWIQSLNFSNSVLNSSFSEKVDSDRNTFSEEYIGYRGFYYKTK